MATYPVFSVGEVLTADDMNAVSGWKVADITLSGTSTNAVGCFSSDYDNYLILAYDLQTSATADIYVRMLSGTTPQSTGGNYNWALTGIYAVGGGSANSNGAGANLGFTGWAQVGVNNVVMGAFSIEVYGPNKAQRTFMTVESTVYNGSTFGARSGLIQHNATTAYDGIQFLTDSTATMGGKVVIYGYRKP